MVAMPQIGRKLNGKRKERRLVQRAVQQIAAPTLTVMPKPLPPRTALTGTEWQETYQEWTQSHAGRPSGLTPDMLRREHLYGEDEDA